MLRRPTQRAVSGLALAQAGAALAASASAIEPFKARSTWRPQLADAGGGTVPEAAVSGRADALVTHGIDGVAHAALQFGSTVPQPGRVLERIRQ